MEITTVGLDIAKTVFQVHAIGGGDRVVVRRALKRAQMSQRVNVDTPTQIGGNLPLAATAGAHQPHRFVRSGSPALSLAFSAAAAGLPGRVGRVPVANTGKVGDEGCRPLMVDAGWAAGVLLVTDLNWRSRV